MQELTLITGASSNHFHCLENLLYTIQRYEPDTHTVVYDLGLTPEEREKLEQYPVTIQTFDFAAYPSFVDIRNKAGSYAWKPIIVADCLETYGGMIFWLDAGCIVLRPLHEIRHQIDQQGLHTPPSNGDIAKWTHPATLAKLQVTEDLLDKPNRTAGIIGFSSARPEMRELAQLWKMHALDMDCIAPPGSDRSNHRQDQAILSVLIYQFQKTYPFELAVRPLGILAQTDGRSRTEIDRLLKLYGE